MWVDTSTVTWHITQEATPPSEQPGSREGFINETLRTKASSGREALKGARPQLIVGKTGRPLIRA